MGEFIKGKKLSELFYNEIVEPILKKRHPDLVYSAGLLGHGSDVIGFDTPRSMDHDWGPRVMLFLSKEDFSKKDQMSGMLGNELPYSFRGFSTHYGISDDDGVKILQNINKGKINHRVEIFTIESFFKKYLHFDINNDISVSDWLVFPEQKLLTIASGKIFHDDLNLKETIERFRYYPKDVWYYLLASQWTRIAQEEHLTGRCGEVNDEIGSKIIAARLVRDIMRMCFLMEKQYAPYPKWFGSAFDNLKPAKELKPVLCKVIESNDWKTREKHLSKAYEYLARVHNSLKITKPLKVKVDYFHNRPFLIINGGLFASEIKKQIEDPAVKSIKTDMGSINQFSDSTDVLEMNTQKFKSVYK